MGKHFLAIITILAVLFTGLSIRDLNQVISATYKSNANNLEDITQELVSMKDGRELDNIKYITAVLKVKELEELNERYCSSFQPNACLNATEEIYARMPAITSHMY